MIGEKFEQLGHSLQALGYTDVVLNLTKEQFDEIAGWLTPLNSLKAPIQPIPEDTMLLVYCGVHYTIVCK